LYVAGSELLVYAGLAALVAASSADLWRRIRPKAGPVLDSEITCPKCGVRRKERMPSDACQFFYECRGCGALLRPKQGDCCVFCSYGSVKCPPMQLA
jgi:rubredoxin